MTMTTIRTAALKEALLDRQREMQQAVESRVREGRAHSSRDVGDILDSSDADIQRELDFALLEMRAATLSRIDEALLRLDAGKYGDCFECGEEIAQRRLVALPFAVRCQACEGQREAEGSHARPLSPSRGHAALTPYQVRS